MIPNNAGMLKCLRCKHSPLSMEAVVKDGERVIEGWVYCSMCHEKWPIVRGVPRFVTAGNYASSFGSEWNLFPKTQLDSYTGTTISRDRFEEVAQTKPSELIHKQVLECGCGMGRFLEVLGEAGANVVGVDYSTAVDAAFSNLRKYPNVTIIQADLFNLPLQPGQFDFVYSIGVLHHTPNTRQALRAIAPYVKPLGTLAIWVYRRYNLFRPYRLYRYIFRHFSAAGTLRIVKLYHPISWQVRRIPLIGKALSVILPVADYRGLLPLKQDHQLEWSYLDTVDALTPWYEGRHTPGEARQWFEELGYEQIEVGSTPCSVKGRRPASAPPRPLDDPGLDADGRERAREQDCGPLDDKAGERIAKTLRSLNG